MMRYQHLQQLNCHLSTFHRFLKTIEIVNGEVTATIIKHPKGSVNVVGFENISNSIILCNVVHRTGTKGNNCKK